MGDGTNTPYTREDVLMLIEEHVKAFGIPQGLDLSEKVLKKSIDLSGLNSERLNLEGIKLRNVRLFRANFNGSNLDGAIMQGANLQYATFNPLNSKAAILCDIDFRGARLQNAEFREANLSGAQFQGEHDQLLPAYLENTDFRGANLFLTNFKGCFFYGTKFEGACIRGADIYDAHLEDADWGSYIIGEEQKGEYYFAEGSYRRLKMWYTHAGMHDTAAKFYYREKEAERKSLKWRSKSSFFHRLKLQLSWAAFGHGERWRRIPLWMAVFLILFASAYYLLGGLEPLDSLYFSAVSFTALGYGNWAPEPIGWVKVLGAFEAFVGVFMMALLLVTLVRQWTR